MPARVRPALVLGVAAITGACDALSDPPPDNQFTTTPGSAATGAGAGGGTVPSGASGSGAGPAIVGITIPNEPSCSLPDAGTPVFSAQIFDYEHLFQRELYTWTTDEQIAELREGKLLLTRTEREGLGPGYAFDVLTGIAAYDTQPINQLAAYLAGEAFAKARYAWPHPWATRMGWPGESYGNNLVRILLREDAWIVSVRSGTLEVRDAQNAIITLEQALATPERIALIFFEKDSSSGGPVCGGSFVDGANGYREYIVGNEAMIEEWSIATPEILAKLDSDLTLLHTFLERIRNCPATEDPIAWNLEVCCSWPSTGIASEFSSYEQSLAMPSPYYLPAPAEMVELIETLESARFAPDPLIVSPGG